tara:strand:+ start:781 stop:1947 length:1167 start_codon:yes stop_codon:yes gene_type:complete
MDNLLKEAIADAKAVRETALANAKIALEEAFTPKLQRMLSAKLAQEDGEPEAVEDEDLEEQADTEEPMEDTSDLPAEESGDEAYEDDGVEDGMSEDEVDENDDMEEPMEDTSPMGEGEEAEEDEDFEEDEDLPAEDELPAEEDEEAYEDDELDLEAIIRELEADAEEDEEPVEEQSDSSDIGEDDNVVEPAEGDDEEKDETDDSSAAPGAENEDDEVVDDLDEGEEAEEDEEPLDLESIIKELEDEMEGEEAEEDEEPAEESAKAKLAKVNADLAEHRKVVRYLSSKLHEVNLLNAKLLYTNKLFRAHSLKENQKLRVIETFDRAKNLREVKLVFTTMAESFGSTPGKKRRMTENAASRPTASTKPSRKVITEGQVLANRFKKLAGIK